MKKGTIVARVGEDSREQRFLAFAAAELLVRRETRGEGDDAEEVRLLEGYGAVFDSDSVDMGFVEEIDPGAFDEVLSGEPDTRGLFNHDSNNILGRTSAGTMRLEVDDVGLRFEIDLPDTQLGRDLPVSIERGDITGNSFSFTVAEDSWDYEADPPRRRILRVGELFDAGPVTFPAYQETVVSARSAELAKEGPAAGDHSGRNELELYQRRARLHELEDENLTEATAEG